MLWRCWFLLRWWKRWRRVAVWVRGGRVVVERGNSSGEGREGGVVVLVLVVAIVVMVCGDGLFPGRKV
jgi:hypothetical protein